MEVETFFKKIPYKSLSNYDKYRREHPYCEICGKRKKDTHHIIFRSRGGGDEDGNLISLCWYHNDVIHGLRIIKGTGRMSWRSKRIALRKRWEILWGDMQKYGTALSIGLEKINLIKRVLQVDNPENTN
jgi:hypothetical protein